MIILHIFYIYSVNRFQEKIALISEEKISKNNLSIEAIDSKAIDQSTCYILDTQNSNKMASIEKINLSKSENCFIESTEIKQVDLIKSNSKIPTVDPQNGSLNTEKCTTRVIKSQNIDLNPLELSTVQQKSAHKSNNFFSCNNVTSTPLKTCSSMQNFDTYDWLSPHDLLKPNIVYQKDDLTMPSKTSNTLKN
jgi:hypothetical protein